MAKTPDPAAALERLAAAGATFKQARADLATATDEVRAAAADALRSGATQTKVIELSGYTRETVRGIAREHGIGPR